MEENMGYILAVKYVVAGLCMAVGAFASAMGQGYIGGKFLDASSRNPSSYNEYFKGTLICLGFVETSSLLSLLVALLILFT